MKMKVYEVRGSFGIENLAIVERPRPLPGHGEVVVKVRAASVNYRDLLVVKGLYNPRLPLPRIPFSDGAGEVIAVGSGVSRVKEGDRVAGIFMQKWLSGELTEAGVKSALGGEIDGMLAEYAVLPEEGVVHLPDHLSYEEAATLPCAAVTAWHAVIETGVKPGDTVLVLGTGGVSVFALQFARLAGAQVIATSGSDAKIDKAIQLGGRGRDIASIHEGSAHRRPDQSHRRPDREHGRGESASACHEEGPPAGNFGRFPRDVRVDEPGDK
jgi:NADPH:quinone reductase-like Zn-dependent oxidoreductase